MQTIRDKSSASDPPTNVRWTVFGLACGTSWLLYLHRYAFALIKPAIAEEWGLDEEQLGYLDSVSSLCYTVFQVPLGVAADSIGVHPVLTALIVVWTLGLGMHAWAANFGQLTWARGVLGVGQSAAYAAINRISKDWFPASVRTTWQGITAVTFGRVGGLSANLLFGSLLVGMLELEWRTAVNIFVVIGLAHAIAFYALFRNEPRAHPWVNEAEASLIEGPTSHGAGRPAPARTSIGAMLCSLTSRARNNLVAINVQTILSTFADNIYSHWLPLFLGKVYLMESTERGFYSALPLLGGAVGGAIGGKLNDLLIARTQMRRWSRSGVAIAGKTMAAVMLFAALAWYDQPYVFCGLLIFVKFFGDWSLATTWGVITDIGGQATASVFAFNNAIAGIGSIAAPMIVGYLAKFHGWPSVIVAVACTYVLCALSWLPINCTIPMISPEPEAASEGK